MQTRRGSVLSMQQKRMLPSEDQKENTFHPRESAPTTKQGPIKTTAQVGNRPTSRSSVLTEKNLASQPSALAVKRERPALNAIHQTTTNKVTKTTVSSKTSAKKLSVEAAKAAISESQAILRPSESIRIDSDGAGKAVRPASRIARPRITAKTRVGVKEEPAPSASQSSSKEAPVGDIEEKKSSAKIVSQEKFEVEPTRTETVDSEEEPLWDDLDQEDANDPMMVSEYVVEIFNYMKELEIETLPNADYMNTQKDLQWKMRTILIDWLIDIHHKFRLLPETLYLSVNIIDRFLTLRVVSMAKLQLVGIVSMFIAAKYEEIIAPSVKNFLYMSDDGYTEEEILAAERYVLGVLEFNLRYPSPMSFLRRCSKAEHYDVQTRTLAKYLMEISIVDYRFIGIVPSKIAAAGLLLARKMLFRDGWDANLCHYSGYTEKDLKGTADLMIDYLAQPNKHQALFKKYASKKYVKCSIYARDWLDGKIPRPGKLTEQAATVPEKRTGSIAASQEQTGERRL